MLGSFGGGPEGFGQARPPSEVLPRQSVGKGCQKSICPWALWLSKVDTVFKHGFEAIYPLQHSGVVGGFGGGPQVFYQARPLRIALLCRGTPTQLPTCRVVASRLCELYKGTSLIRNAPPPRITIRP